MSVALNRSAVGAATGTGRRIEAFQPRFRCSPLTVGWPNLCSRFGVDATVGLPAAGIGAGGQGFGTGAPLTWIEGNRIQHYGWNLPIKFSRAAGELGGIDNELNIIRATLQWSGVTVPTFDSGFFCQAYSGNAGSIISLMTNAAGGATCRGFGVGRRPFTDGALGFFGIVGNTVVFTPITHPAGAVTKEMVVEYRIYDSKNGAAARLEVWINNVKTLAAAFTAGNALGLPYDFPVVNNSQFLAYFSVEASMRLWCGEQVYSAGPADTFSL